MKTSPWTDPSDLNFKYRGHELARKKAFLVSSNDDTVPELDQEPSMLPKYTYPGFQYGSMRSYRDVRTVPSLERIVAEIQQRLAFNDGPVSINHSILTCYRDGNDNIGFHSDKMIDITPNSPIISLSLGQDREFHLGQADPNDRKATVTTHRMVLSSGDLFILGPRTNALYRHSIVPSAKKEIRPHVSIVMRNIATLISRTKARTKAKRTENARKIGKPEAEKSGRRIGNLKD